MVILGQADKVIIKKHKEGSERLERIEEVKKCLIKIKPTRYNNIMWSITYDAKTRPPSDITIYYFNEKLTSMRSSPKSTLWIEPTISKDGKFASYLVDETPDQSLNFNNGEPYSYMGFNSSFAKEDFEFSVEVFLKYTYIITAGKIQKEVSFENGLLWHAEGDRFSLGGRNEAVVMEIDHDNAIVYCGAIGENL